ncbi:Dyp-type peroxidase [Deminuibacter soli]|uniref:Dyp-type peroxidase n=1 Tax=Deminuibacter soli TaxID=2291815 RepID=A0A3E1NCL0_9BACT|nr:Dyp-type peroxidase [Deminuibacter soli]RFM25745.1 Dyp-type peroxidase [Deminuibacter soli]
MEIIEKEDIQGIIVKGYAHLPACKFVLLGMGSKQAAQQWLQLIAQNITRGSEKKPPAAVNLAFTYEGLKVLGLDGSSLDTFPLEFEDGMTTPHKQLFLGDFGNSAPDKWEWGGPQQTPVHALLMLYAPDETSLQLLYDMQRQHFAQFQLTEIKRLDTAVLGQRKEHFGFHDGIAQPTIKGLGKQDTPENTVAAGEFILGYKDAYNQYPDTPQVPLLQGKESSLPPAVKPGMLDFGKNGSYLVFRQMAQDVQVFWQYIESITMQDGKSDEQAMIQLAAKMVGRWPSGAPVSVCPDKDDTSMESRDDFGYRAVDSAGLRCPIGSHIRRTNPRDAMDASSSKSMEIANKHRILRRGRSYGKPVCDSLEPAEILRSKNFEGERGLYFICFNAAINRQFEFIQNAWVNNPKLLGLNHERDPLIGNNAHPDDAHQCGFFSVPANGLRRHYSNIPDFTTVKGGAYFFMPGLHALAYLAAR